MLDKETEALMRTMPVDEQVVAASALAANFKALTGQPIMVHPGQMKFFKEAGVDCSNLMLYGDWGIA